MELSFFLAVTNHNQNHPTCATQQAKACAVYAASVHLGCAHDWQALSGFKSLSLTGLPAVCIYQNCMSCFCLPNDRCSSCFRLTLLTNASIQHGNIKSTPPLKVLLEQVLLQTQAVNRAAARHSYELGYEAGTYNQRRLLSPHNHNQVCIPSRHPESVLIT